MINGSTLPGVGPFSFRHGVVVRSNLLAGIIDNHDRMGRQRQTRKCFVHHEVERKALYLSY